MIVCLIRSVILSAALLTFLTGFGLSQDKKQTPELKGLSGEWELSVRESKISFGTPYVAGSLVVKVQGEEVTIKRNLEDRDGSVERDLSYFTDGRGEINVWTTFDGETEIERKSTSKWKKGKLVIKWSQKSNFGWYDVEEIYDLADDGKKLTYTVTPQLVRAGFTRPTTFTEKLVFRKKW